MSDTEGVEFLRLARTVRCTQFDRVPRPHAIQEVAREMSVQLGRGLPLDANVTFRIIIEARVEQ